MNYVSLISAMPSGENLFPGQQGHTKSKDTVRGYSE